MVLLSQGECYKQYVSHEQAKRDKVHQLLQVTIDENLKRRAAKSHGICSVRENIHMQLFDEVIRQVTLDCVERGLLLFRCKEEAKMSLASYQTLYQSSLTYGIRKKMQAEHGKSELLSKLENLQKKNTLLRNKEMTLRNKKDETDRRIKERADIDSTRRKNEMEYLNTQMKRIKTFLELAKKQSTAQ